MTPQLKFYIEEPENPPGNLLSPAALSGPFTVFSKNLRRVLAWTYIQIHRYISAAKKKTYTTYTVYYIKMNQSNIKHMKFKYIYTVQSTSYTVYTSGNRPKLSYGILLFKSLTHKHNGHHLSVLIGIDQSICPQLFTAMA